jgi:hypothetical protein
LRKSTKRYMQKQVFTFKIKKYFKTYCTYISWFTINILKNKKRGIQKSPNLSASSAVNKICMPKEVAMEIKEIVS